MDEMKYVNKYFSALFEKYGFQISSTYNPGDSLTVESRDVNIRFSDERGQMLVEFQSNHFGKKDEYSWYSIDIMRELITGETKCNGFMDKSNLTFMQKNIEKILGQFSESNAKNTILKLRKLEKIRARDLMGNSEE